MPDINSVSSFVKRGIQKLQFIAKTQIRSSNIMKSDVVIELCGCQQFKKLDDPGTPSCNIERQLF